MVLALGHTLYLVHIETATVLPPSHQTRPPDSRAHGRPVQDAQISTMRGVTEISGGQNGRCLNMDQIQGVSQRQRTIATAPSPDSLSFLVITHKGPFRSPLSIFKETFQSSDIVSDCSSFCNGLGHSARLAEFSVVRQVIGILMQPAIGSGSRPLRMASGPQATK